MNVKTLALAWLPLLGAGWLLSTPALAQESMRDDPIMVKRADLRLKWIMLNREAKSATDSDLKMQRTMLDRSRMVDFMSLAAKRADMRSRITEVGIDRAYQEWLDRQPGRYR